MNTDQAYELLIDAGVSDEMSIQMVRQWLRERKIKYVGTVYQKSEYIIDSTQQAFTLLRDAGVEEPICIQVVQRWLNEGKVKKSGAVKEVTERKTSNTATSSPLANPIIHDKFIAKLKGKIKAQEEHIKGLEQLHKNSMNRLIQQRNKLNQELLNLENEKSGLQTEVKNILKENMDLRNQLLQLKEKSTEDNKKDSDKTQVKLPFYTNDTHQKLGLSRKADHKEVIAGYKKLMKVTHPDQGGDAAVFHYIKSDYDSYRNSYKH